MKRTKIFLVLTLVIPLLVAVCGFVFGDTTFSWSQAGQSGTLKYGSLQLTNVSVNGGTATGLTLVGGSYGTIQTNILAAATTNAAQAVTLTNLDARVVAATNAQVVGDVASTNSANTFDAARYVTMTNLYILADVVATNAARIFADAAIVTSTNSADGLAAARDVVETNRAIQAEAVLATNGAPIINLSTNALQPTWYSGTVVGIATGTYARGVLISVP